MIDFDPFERRLAVALRFDADLSVAPFDPASIARAAIQLDHGRQGRRSLRRRGNPRTMRRTWLLVAATIAIGTAVVGASLVGGRLIAPSPVPTAPLAVTSPTAEQTSPSPSPSETTPAVAPAAPVFVFNKGAGTSAECGNDGRGGCIPRMWVANLDGSGAHELLPGQGGCQRAVAWSPDGTRLLFSRSDCHFDPGWGLIGTNRFYLTDASGSEPRLVDTGCVDPCVSEYDAVFSADGSRILFIRTRSIPPPPSATDPVTGKPAQGTEVKVLASIDLATNHVTELGKFDACDQCSIGEDGTDPVWSPDRTHIVYTLQHPTQGPEPAAITAVLVADADGRNVHQLSASGGTPAWSPDGTRIAFRSERYTWKGTWKPGVVVHPFYDIYTIRADGTDLVRLTSDGISANPEWSSDGRIRFLLEPNFLDAGENAQSWVMDADGSNAAQLSAAQLAAEPPFQAWQVQRTP